MAQYAVLADCCDGVDLASRGACKRVIDSALDRLKGHSLNGRMRLEVHDGGVSEDFEIDLAALSVRAESSQDRVDAVVRVSIDSFFEMMSGRCSPLDCLGLRALNYGGDEALLLQAFRALATDEDAIFAPCQQGLRP